MMGAGKYYEETQSLRSTLPARGVLLIVIEGPKGTGFEIQIPPELCQKMPMALREVADKMEADLARITAGKRG